MKSEQPGNGAQDSYIFEVRLPMAKFAAPLQELEESLNSTLAMSGVQQKLVLTFETEMTMKVSRQLSDKELQTMIELLREQLKSAFGFADIISIRHKPGNVQQSATSAS